MPHRCQVLHRTQSTGVSNGRNYEVLTQEKGGLHRASKQAYQCDGREPCLRELVAVLGLQVALHVAHEPLQTDAELCLTICRLARDHLLLQLLVYLQQRRGSAQKARSCLLRLVSCASRTLSITWQRTYTKVLNGKGTECVESTAAAPRALASHQGPGVPSGQKGQQQGVGSEAMRRGWYSSGLPSFRVQG